MPTKLHKSFSDYFCMMKKPLISFPSKSLSSSGSWIFRGCRHPRTPSFSIPAADDRQDDGGGGGQVTLADVDRFLLENFKSIYLSEEENVSRESNADSIPCDSVPPLKLEGSARFAVTSELGSSSSLDAASSSGVTTLDDLLRSSKDDDDDDDYDGDQSDVSGKDNSLGLEDFITVSTYSTSPCDEFKRSMQEMMEARLNHHGKIDWEFMEELLLCYLNLNDKKSYKFVLSAFVDLIADYGVDSGGVSTKSREVGSTEGRGKEKGT